MSDIESGYRSNNLLKREGVKIEYTQEQLEEYIKCSNDPVYFIENYMTVIHVDKGVVPFKLYNFQKEMIQAMHENRHTCILASRQTGKSVTTIGYILWMSLFRSDQVIAILANKGQLARDLLDRYQLSYESIPHFLQQGVSVWQKGTVVLENQTKVFASSTSANALRGSSVNFLYLDEFAFLHNNMAESFFTSVYPVISSGETTKLVMSSTPNGMNLFYKIWTDAVAGRNGYKPVRVNWYDVPGRDEKYKEEYIKSTSQRQWDQEMACNFLGSTNTLISGEKLASLAYKEPVGKYSEMIIYEQPIKDELDFDTGKQIAADHLYAITVDVSEGKNLDYHAFSVFDISTMPYKQVAVYRNNTLPPMLYPTIIKACAEYYNNAYVLIEINMNPQTADILVEDLGYENVLRVFTGNKKPQMLSMRGGKGIAQGLKMTPLAKRLGCSTLKTLVENDKLIVNDFETISELTTFVQEGPTYRAEEGCNDDLAMTLVIFGWLASQKLFKEIVSHDLRKQLQIENLDFIEEEEMLPIIELVDGIHNKNYFIEGNSVWIETNNKNNIYKDIFDDHFGNDTWKSDQNEFF